jgi:hypothetical protein
VASVALSVSGKVSPLGITQSLPIPAPRRGFFARLDDHLAGNKHTTADVVAKAQAVVLSEPELLRAMFDVGYFPPNTPPGTRF